MSERSVVKRAVKPFAVLVSGVVIAVFNQACGTGMEPTNETTRQTSQALGTTYNVGPTRAYTKLQDLPALAPGDLVLVDYGTYPAPVRFTQDGTAANPITIRGCIPGVANCIADSGGRRPIIKAGINQPGQMDTIAFDMSDFYTFENFEVDVAADEGNRWDVNAGTGTAVAIRHRANGITIRNVYIHDCPWHGLLGTETESGSLTMEYSEVARCGESDRHHPIYMDTDENMYPGAVFRLQHCYIHDGVGGNLVKSRAERNEIYYNWLENGFYRELELIGNDDDGAPPRPMNSDVVGNVILKTNASNTSNNVRVGHDWSDATRLTGSHGRYRFVNNTFVLPSSTTASAMMAMGALESLEMHNNVYYRQGGGAIQLLRDDDAQWIAGSRRIVGQNNWVTTGSTVPAEWNAATTLTGTDPGFVSSTDVRLRSTSPLIDAGTASAPASPSGSPFPNPLYPPSYVPPARAATTSATPRSATGTIDIGAYESGTGATCSYSINPTTASVAAPGGSGSISVTAPAGCSWTASSGASWVTITSGATGSGNGSVAYTVSANTGSARSGVITVAQQSHTVNQAGTSTTSGTIDVYRDQTNVTFAGGSAGVQATIAAGEGIGASNAIKHSNLQIWDATKKLVLPAAVDISSVQATDKLRISLDVSAGRASNIYIYFNDDWQTYLITPVLDQTAGYQTFEIVIGDAMRARLGNAVNNIYFKAGSGFPDSGTLKVDDIQFVVGSAPSQPPSGSLADIYTDETNVSFDGGSSGVVAAVVAGDGVGGSNAIRHSNLQIWDATKSLELPTPVDISGVLATDVLRISLDVSAGRASNIYIYFNNDWQTFLVTPVLDEVAGYQTFDIPIGSTMRTRLGNTVNGIYFKAGNGFPDSGTLKVDNIRFVRP